MNTAEPGALRMAEDMSEEELYAVDRDISHVPGDPFEHLVEREYGELLRIKDTRNPDEVWIQSDACRSVDC